MIQREKIHDDHCGWISLARDLVAGQEAAALALIANTYGSTPRETGSWVLVTATQQYGTVGGGNLEHQVVERLRGKLDAGDGIELEQFVLGPDMAQCCGGALDILLQNLTLADLDWLQAACQAGDDMVLTLPLTEGPDPAVQLATAKHAEGQMILPLGGRPPTLALFGTGHVGAALCQILAATEWQVLAADNRGQQRQDVAGLAKAVSDLSDVTGYCTQLPENCYALIMTHSHDLDYEICRTLLQRTDLVFVGLIGSKSKAVRFRHNLKRDGFTKEQIERLTSPIGISGLPGKHPGTVALAAAAQIGQIEAARRAANRAAQHGEPEFLENQQ